MAGPNNLTPADAVARGKEPRWFADFAAAAFTLAEATRRAVIATVAAGAIAVIAGWVSYWADSAGHYPVAVGAQAVFALALLAAFVIAAYILWLNCRGIAGWLYGRRRSSAPGLLSSPTDAAPE